ncbi:YbaK/EbsC family protein [Bacillus wiedmannii]|nr:YbaK/EbsC family protein [Bacillus wiedmannii]SCN36117.1 YbaK/prolyl-tRNA synthetase associated region [Bacillus wiedmannii]
MEDRIIEVKESSATVELAAKALQCEPQRIAKTLSFQTEDRVLVIVTAGDAKIDNRKYKEQFGVKANMVDANKVEELIGHAIGGVCPFAVNEDVDVYLDVSLQRFITVFPACGSGNSAIELTIEELERYSKYLKWIDVCKGYAN